MAVWAAVQFLQLPTDQDLSGVASKPGRVWASGRSNSSKPNLDARRSAERRKGRGRRSQKENSDEKFESVSGFQRE